MPAGEPLDGASPATAHETAAEAPIPPHAITVATGVPAEGTGTKDKGGEWGVDRKGGNLWGRGWRLCGLSRRWDKDRLKRVDPLWSFVLDTLIDKIETWSAIPARRRH